MKVIAVVVTYNRLVLLKKNINCLRANKPVSSIVVVNNGSTDDTGEWLESQKDIVVITQENVGGSGGFFTGMQYAFNEGADYIWCMDDDVFPREDCLEKLLAEAKNEKIGILAPRRLLEGKVYTNDFRAYNLTNPLASMHSRKLAGHKIKETTEVAGTAFEGPLISSKVVKDIGFPNKELFIFCDDTDYCLRAVLAGYKILYVPSALMDKQPFFSLDSWAEKNKKKKWKRYYQVRNSTYMNHHYGKNWGVRYLRGFLGVMGYILTALVTAPFSEAWHLSEIPKLWRAYKDGINERLGIIDNK